MSFSLVVDAPGAVLRRHGEHLVVGRESERLANAPLASLRDVTLIGRVEVTSAAIDVLLERRLPLVWLTASGRFRGVMLPEAIAGIAARRAQYTAWSDSDRRLALARRFVEGRLGNARGLALRFSRSGRTPGHLRALEAIDRSRAGAREALSLAALRGHEGQGTRAWFGILRTLVPADWGFARRTRRPPKDPFSALLSFGYAVLFSRVAAAVCAAGLDAALGFLHDPSPARPALALDLMEELRGPLVEAVVLNTIRRRMITLADLEVEPNEVRLMAPARRVLLQQLHRRLDDRLTTDGGERRYATVIVDQASQLARALQRGDEYEPVRIR